MLHYGGFSYAWHENAFLSRNQAHYAMACLWSMVAGSSKWEGNPAIVFPAVSIKQVEAELDLRPGELPWIKLSTVLPRGTVLNFDTDSFPAICRMHMEMPSCYNGQGIFPLDLPAAVFLGLTRWEEWKRPVLDAFGCHDEQATQCARQKYLDRPVLDEWAMVVRKWIEMKDPSWQAVLPVPRIWISHDIDNVRYFKNLFRIIKGFAKGIIHQRSISLAFKYFLMGLRAVRHSENDPFYKGIRDLMDLDEFLGLKGTFFFMTARDSELDDGYDMHHPTLFPLLKELRKRGHEIGWHVGYLASKYLDVFEKEKNLFCILDSNGQSGARHHYLAWRGPESWRRIANSGFGYDSSLGYNYIPGGFRCGTAYPYQAFDLQRDSVLPLIERPLIVMDGPVMLMARQKNLIEADEMISKLYNRTILSGGCFSILIHNSIDWEYPGALTFFKEWLSKKL